MQKQPKHFASCLLIDYDKKRALLIEKLKPEFQMGRLNIVGGKVEEGETYSQAAIREVGEEVGLQIEFEHMRYFCKLYNTEDNWVVHFHTIYCNIDNYTKMTTETPVIIDLDKIPSSALYNLSWLIPMATDPAENYAEVECVHSDIVERPYARST